MTDVTGDGIASPRPGRLCNLHASRFPLPLPHFLETY